MTCAGLVLINKNFTVFSNKIVMLYIDFFINEKYYTFCQYFLFN